MDTNAFILAQPGSAAVLDTQSRLRLSSGRFPLDATVALVDWPAALQDGIRSGGWALPRQRSDEEVAPLEQALREQRFDPAASPIRLALLPASLLSEEQQRARAEASEEVERADRQLHMLPPSTLANLQLVVLTGRSRWRLLLQHQRATEVRVQALEVQKEKGESEIEEEKRLKAGLLTGIWAEVYDQTIFGDAGLYHHFISSSSPDFTLSHHLTLLVRLTRYQRTRTLSLSRLPSPWPIQRSPPWRFLRDRSTTSLVVETLEICNTFTRLFDFVSENCLSRLFSASDTSLLIWSSLFGTATFIRRLSTVTTVSFRTLWFLTTSHANPLAVPSTSPSIPSAVHQRSKQLAAELRAKLAGISLTSAAAGKRHFGAAFQAPKKITSSVFAPEQERREFDKEWKEIVGEMKVLVEVLDAEEWTEGLSAKDLVASPVLLFPHDLSRLASLNTATPETSSLQRLRALKETLFCGLRALAKDPLHDAPLGRELSPKASLEELVLSGAASASETEDLKSQVRRRSWAEGTGDRWLAKKESQSEGVRRILDLLQQSRHRMAAEMAVAQTALSLDADADAPLLPPSITALCPEAFNLEPASLATPASSLPLLSTVAHSAHLVAAVIPSAELNDDLAELIAALEEQSREAEESGAAADGCQAGLLEKAREGILSLSEDAPAPKDKGKGRAISPSPSPQAEQLPQPPADNTLSPSSPCSACTSNPGASTSTATPVTCRHHPQSLALVPRAPLFNPPSPVRHSHASSSPIPSSPHAVSLAAQPHRRASPIVEEVEVADEETEEGGVGKAPRSASAGAKGSRKRRCSQQKPPAKRARPVRAVRSRGKGIIADGDSEEGEASDTTDGDDDDDSPSYEGGSAQQSRSNQEKAAAEVVKGEKAALPSHPVRERYLSLAPTMDLLATRLMLWGPAVSLILPSVLSFIAIVYTAPASPDDIDLSSPESLTLFSEISTNTPLLSSLLTNYFLYTEPPSVDACLNVVNPLSPPQTLFFLLPIITTLHALETAEAGKNGAAGARIVSWQAHMHELANSVPGREGYFGDDLSERNTVAARLRVRDRVES